MAERRPRLIVEKNACISACGDFRYQLERRWGEGAPLLFIMLNPSTADSNFDDPTIRRCRHFALAHRFNAIEVVNLFAFRATEPIELSRAGYPVGQANDFYLDAAIADAGSVCVAWGAHGGSVPVERRVQEVMPMLFRRQVQPLCLNITRGGHPSHPLMLRNDCRLRPFTAAAIEEAMHGGR